LVFTSAPLHIIVKYRANSGIATADRRELSDAACIIIIFIVVLFFLYSQYGNIPRQLGETEINNNIAKNLRI